MNVTRQGDGATRASYNESTRKLEFSDGDKLFVEGSHIEADRFAGTLTWQSGETFSGTIYTESPYGGTIDDLLNGNYATLLPAGYGSYDYLEIIDEGYEARLGENAYNSFATSKKLGVEQLSFEHGEYTSGTGFVLEPRNAILNFTVTGLTGNKSVDVSYSASMLTNIEGSVTTDGDGTATFAIGVEDGTDLAGFTLTVDGIAITTVTSSKTVTAGKIYNITRGTGSTVDLSTKSTAYTASNGETLTGTLASNVKISIADGATVILHNVNINGSGTWKSGDYAGITCEGDATIILSGTNTVKGFYEDYPGIFAAKGKTLTIQGTGSLNVSSNGIGAAGIGGGEDGACGNIVISGGTITATGGEGAAGIGSGRGYITSGVDRPSTCGTITITSGVTQVTATKGSGATNSIGSGQKSTCGTVTIGGTEYWDGSAYKNGGDTYLTTSPLTYPAAP